MADILACSQVNGSGNDGGSQGAKNSKKRSASSKRQSPSGISNDGAAADGGSRHSSTSAKRKPAPRTKSEKLKRLPVTSSENPSAARSVCTTGTSKSSSSATKTSKIKRKPASRAKSFDGTTVAGRGISCGGPRKGGKKPTKEGANANLKMEKQDINALKASSEHAPRNSNAKPKRIQRKQEESLLGSMPDMTFQTPKQQVVGDLFVKRRSSKLETNMMVPSIGASPSATTGNSNNSTEKEAKQKRSKSNTRSSSKHRRRSSSKTPDAKGNNNKGERGRSGAKRQATNAMEDGSIKDPSQSYFPQREASKDLSVRHLASKSPKRSSSKSRSRRRSSSRSKRGLRSVSNGQKPSKSSSLENKPKLPTRTLSANSLQGPNSSNQQIPSTLLGGEPDENDAEQQPTEGTFPLENSVQSRGLSLMAESKSSVRTSASRTCSKYQPMTPPHREKSISNRGNRTATSSTGSPENLLNLKNKQGGDSDDDEEEDILVDSQKFLDKSKNNTSDNSKEGASWQVDEKAANALSQGKETKRRIRDVPQQQKTLKNAALPARKKSDPDINVLDDVDDESDSDSEREQRKSLCGLLPKTTTSITAESSVSGTSMPLLLDSSFSSVNTTDESVCSYLSQKKPGLIVASQVSEGPMKHFLGNLTATIEKKQVLGPPNGSQTSLDEQSVDPSESMGEKQKKGSKDNKKSLEASLNASFMASGVNILAGSTHKPRPDSDESSLPGLMTFKKEEKELVPLEPLPTQPEETEMDLSLPSLMSFGPKGGGAVAPPPRKAEDDMDASLPSLMSFGPVGQQIDDSSSMPSLSSFRTNATSQSALDESTDDCSLPSLASMPDASVVGGGRRHSKGKRLAGPTGNPLEDIPDGDEESEDEEDEAHEAEHEQEQEEPWDEGDGTEYEESMTELDGSDLGEREYQKDQEEVEPDEDDGGDSGASEEESEEDEEEDGNGGRQEEDEEQSQSPSVLQFVVKKKKEKSKPKKDAKEEQVQMWQAEFQQEHIMQQQQMFWQQQQQLLQQQMMMQQQQLWNANGMVNPQLMMMNGMVPNQIIDPSGSMLSGSKHLVDSSVASGMLSSSRLDALETSSQGSLQSGRSDGTKTKKSMLRKSQSLDYDFSFMDHPEMPEVSEVSADDILQPMNPSYRDGQDDNAGRTSNASLRGKKNEKEKVFPSMSFTSRLKKSVKKIKRNLSGSKPKATSRVDTGLNEMRLFPDMYDDDDEESTMRGLLSG